MLYRFQSISNTQNSFFQHSITRLLRQASSQVYQNKARVLQEFPGVGEAAIQKNDHLENHERNIYKDLWSMELLVNDFRK